MSVATSVQRDPQKAHMLTSPWYSFGQKFNGLTVYGRPASFPVVNERAVRATAGIMMALAAIAIAFAYFDQNFLPVRIISVLFVVDYAPTGSWTDAAQSDRGAGHVPGQQSTTGVGRGIPEAVRLGAGTHHGAPHSHSLQPRHTWINSDGLGRIVDSVVVAGIRRGRLYGLCDLQSPDQVRLDPPRRRSGVRGKRLRNPPGPCLSSAKYDPFRLWRGRVHYLKYCITLSSTFFAVAAETSAVALTKAGRSNSPGRISSTPAAARIG